MAWHGVLSSGIKRMGRLGRMLSRNASSLFCTKTRMSRAPQITMTCELGPHSSHLQHPMLMQQQPSQSNNTNILFQNNSHLQNSNHMSSNNHPNIGRSIDLLRHDLTHFFPDGLRNLTIYSPSIVFHDPFHIPSHPLPSSSLPLILNLDKFTNPPTTTLTVKGKQKYIALAKCIKWLCRLYYDSPELTIVRMSMGNGSTRDDYFEGEGTEEGRRAWRSKEGGENTVSHQSSHGNHQKVRLVVRWIFEGVPKHQMVFSLFNPLAMPKASIYEGVFVYEFEEGDSGLIIAHRVQSIYPSPPVPTFCRWFKRDKMPEGAPSI